MHNQQRDQNKLEDHSVLFVKFEEKYEILNGLEFHKLEHFKHLCQPVNSRQS